jgi:PIN domain nuclease of toxin-antitoxin system
MKNWFIIILLTLTSAEAICQYNIALPGHKKPGQRLIIVTAENNRLEGRLIRIDDSCIVAYPGKQKEWKRKINY